MCFSAICSKGCGRRRRTPAGCVRRVLAAACDPGCCGGGLAWALLVLAGAAVPSAAAGAQLRLTQDQALRLAFPEPAVIERRTAFLGEEELGLARRHAGSEVKIDQRLVTYYVGLEGESPLGVAYFDAHRVRTLPEVLMIVVSPADRVERIETLKFSEPPEYRAPESWLLQFRHRPLSDELSLKRSIVGITGASLTARAVTEATRRVLALHQVIRPFAEGRDMDPP